LDRKLWMIDVAKASGRRNMHICMFGIISEIIRSANNTPNQKVIEVARTLSDLDQVFHDESLPWDQTDIRKAPAPTEAEKEISQPKHTMNVTKAESSLKPWTVEQIMRQEG